MLGHGVLPGSNVAGNHLPRLGREQLHFLLADQFVSTRIAQHPTELVIAFANDSILAQADALEGRAGQRTEPLLALAQGVLGPLAIADIDSRRDQMRDAAVLVEHGRDVKVEGHHPATRHTSIDIKPGGLAGSCPIDGLSNPLLDLRRIVPPIAILEPPAPHVVHRDAGRLERRLIAIEQHAVHVEHAHEHVQC